MVAIPPKKGTKNTLWVGVRLLKYLMATRQAKDILKLRFRILIWTSSARTRNRRFFFLFIFFFFNAVFPDIQPAARKNIFRRKFFVRNFFVRKFSVGKFSVRPKFFRPSVAGGSGGASAPRETLVMAEIIF